MGKCHDCKKDAPLLMLDDNVWQHTRLKHGVLCVACIEKRLERQIEVCDLWKPWVDSLLRGLITLAAHDPGKAHMITHTLNFERR